MSVKLSRIPRNAGRVTLLALACLGLGLASNGALARPLVEQVHFLIPGSAGGGWDSTARETGAALVASGLLGKATYENMSGSGGARAIAHLVDAAARHQNTLLVNSTPILLRNLTRIYPQSFRDLTPVAAIISDYNVFVVRADSRFRRWPDVVEAYRKNPRKLKFGGGSPRNGLDHLIAFGALEAEGVDADKMRYFAYDAGGQAMRGLLAGEFEVLSTGLGEALAASSRGEVRALAVTAPQRLDEAPGIPTLSELGNNTVYANWRGFFAAPGVPAEQVERWVRMFEQMYAAPAWERVRKSHGWVNTFKPAGEFFSFLEQQERRVSRTLERLATPP